MTLSDEIFRTLARAIVSGELAPGVRLDEPSICRRFNVSRTPVREALRQLSGTGLVDVEPRKGVTVRTVDLAQLMDMFDGLAELEGLCARLSAERMTSVERQRLKLFNQSQEAARKAKSTLSDINEQFHELIYKGAHSETIANVVRNFRQRVAPFQVFQFVPQHTIEVFNEHDTITSAIIRADGPAAQDAMRDHIIKSSLQVIDHFEGKASGAKRVDRSQKRKSQRA